MSLNELAKEIYENNKQKGFWPDEGERNPLEVLALIHSEVSECLEEIRDGKWAESTSWHSTTGTRFPRDGRIENDPDGTWLLFAEERVRITEDMWRGWGYVPKPEGVPSELADIIIRVLDACGAWGINIEKAVREKIEYNATRDYKHGRAL